MTASCVAIAYPPTAWEQPGTIWDVATATLRDGRVLIAGAGQPRTAGAAGLGAPWSRAPAAQLAADPHDSAEVSVMPAGTGRAFQITAPS